MGYEIDLYKPRALQRSVYSGVRLAQKIRWRISAEYKPIFDIEASPKYWQSAIKGKAEAAGVTVEAYERALKQFRSMPVVRLAIVIFRCENDFLENWWKNITLAEELAKESIKDDKLGAAKTLLLVEREKMMGIKRLVETGRMIDPAEYATRRPKEKNEEPFEPGKTGVINID